MELMIEGEIIKGFCPNCNKKVSATVYFNKNEDCNFYCARCNTCYLDVFSDVLEECNKRREEIIKNKDKYDMRKLIAYMIENSYTAIDLSFKLDIEFSRLSILLEGLGVPNEEEIEKINKLLNK